MTEASPTAEETPPPVGGFWSYLRQRELDFFPTGALRWWLLGLIIFAWAIEQFERLKIGPVLVYMFDDFGVSLREWGYVGAVAAVTQVGGALLFSQLADRYGRRAIILWPVVAYLGIAVGSALAPNFLTLAVLWVVGGTVVSGMSPAVNAALRDITPQMGRAMVYAWLSLAFTIGALLSTWVAARTIPVWPGWRPQFWIAGGFAAVTVAVLAVFYRDLSMRVRGHIVHDREDALAAAVSEAGFTDFAAAQRAGNLVYRDWRLWALSLAILFWSVAYFTVAMFVPTYFQQHFGIEAAQASDLTSYFWLVFTFSVFVSGWISDRLQVRKTVIAFGGVSTGLCFLWAASRPVGTSYVALALSWSITGWFAGFIYPAWCALVSECAEAISPFGVARAFGITGVLGVGSGLVFNLALPRVVEAWGWTAWIQICALCCFVIVALVACSKGPWRPGRAA